MNKRRISEVKKAATALVLAGPLRGETVLLKPSRIGRRRGVRPFLFGVFIALGALWVFTGQFKDRVASPSPYQEAWRKKFCYEDIQTLRSPDDLHVAQREAAGCSDLTFTVRMVTPSLPGRDAQVAFVSHSRPGLKWIDSNHLAIKLGDAPALAAPEVPRESVRSIGPVTILYVADERFENKALQEQLAIYERQASDKISRHVELGAEDARDVQTLERFTRRLRAGYDQFSAWALTRDVRFVDVKSMDTPDRFR